MNLVHTVHLMWIYTIQKYSTRMSENSNRPADISQYFTFK